ncbi:MAG: hypothetical protein PHF67_04045 [Candidatus Nanoarchaeia archaeon]|nr:hypothetical protein [Candidatus Nanoarchaeia archaeon]
MKDKLNKSETQEKIAEIFSSDTSAEQIKKVKKLAMSKNIKLKGLRKKFCKKCYSLFPMDTSIRIKKGFKTIKCKNCGFISRYQLKQ